MEQKVRLLPSGINDFERIRRDNLYYVDKTQYITTLEGGDSYVFFGRPRRFGKSLFVSMLEAYYDINHGYCDIFLMPERRFKDVKHSYIIEFKHVSTKVKIIKDKIRE